MEWTPTIGLSYRTGSMQLRYNYSKSCARSECLVIGLGGGDRVTVASPTMASTGGVIAAPSSPLTFDGVTASSHKFWVSFPIR
jgi:hypothetical protein